MASTLITLSAHVRFNGDLVLECTGEVVGKANAAQMARSYCSYGPTVHVSHAAVWWQKHAPKAYAMITETPR